MPVIGPMIHLAVKSRARAVPTRPDSLAACVGDRRPGLADHLSANLAFQVQPLHLGFVEFPLTPALAQRLTSCPRAVSRRINVPPIYPPSNNANVHVRSCLWSSGLQVRGILGELIAGHTARADLTVITIQGRRTYVAVGNGTCSAHRERSIRSKPAELGCSQKPILLRIGCRIARTVEFPWKVFRGKEEDNR